MINGLLRRGNAIVTHASRRRLHESVAFLIGNRQFWNIGQARKHRVNAHEHSGHGSQINRSARRFGRAGSSVCWVSCDAGLSSVASASPSGSFCWFSGGALLD